MKSIRQLIRLLHINYVLAKNGLDQVIVSIHLFSPFRFIVYLNPWNWFRRETLLPGVALRRTFETLGPIFIKFGQALSTRPDILPPEVAFELSKLQDSVPPFSSQLALEIVEKAFGQPTGELFAEFNMEPLASASIAQVHAAKLKTGEEVVVKILRPNVREMIEQDLAILKTMAHWADRYWSESKRLKPQEIVQEFERSLLDELDLQREAANASQLRRNFNRSPLLYVPEVYWDLIRPNVLVMERIYGIPVSDVKNLKACGINLKLLAERGLEIFFMQVFRDCFFHADMHPGNIFVAMTQPESPQYICVDFGIMGTLGDEDKRYIAENLMAFFNRDYRRVAILHVESGWVARDTRVDEFESAIRTVCEPIFEKPLKDISFALVVLRLFQVARRFRMVVQPQLVLLQKTLLAVEGLGRQLYPDLDLWVTAKPFLEKWLRQQSGPKAFIKSLRENVPFLMEALPHTPRLIHDVLQGMKRQQLMNRLERETPLATEYIQASWYKGFGTGIFIVMVGWGGIVYFHLLNPQQLSTITWGAALFGAIIAFINRSKRS